MNTQARPYSHPGELEDENEATDPTDPSNPDGGLGANPEESPSESLKHWQSMAEQAKDRYDNLKRHHDGSIDKHKDREADLESQVAYWKSQAESSNHNTMALPTQEDEIAAWVEQNPDVARIVQGLVRRETQESIAPVQQRVEELSGRDLAAARIKARNRLYELHPDFDEVRNSVEYSDWLNNIAAKPFKDALLVNDVDGDAAAQAVDMFKTYYKWGQNKRINKGDKPVKTGKDKMASVEKEAKIWLKSEIANMSDAEFDKLEEELDLAAREGRIREG